MARRGPPQTSRRRHMRAVMRGQVACVCGLVIAGVPFMKSCQIAGISYDLMRYYVPASIKKHMGGKRRWKGDELLDLKDAYDSGMKLGKVAALFGVSEASVRQVVHNEGWPRRRVKHAVTIRSLSHKQQRQYYRALPTMGPYRAFREVMRAGA